MHTHVAVRSMDQVCAITIFGKPQALSAHVRTLERDVEAASLTEVT